MHVTQLALTWVGCQTVKNLRRPACKFDLDQSARKSSQVNASARKPWSNEVASWHKSSTCVNLLVRLARALLTSMCSIIRLENGKTSRYHGKRSRTEFIWYCIHLWYHKLLNARENSGESLPGERAFLRFLQGAGMHTYTLLFVEYSVKF